MEITSSPIAYHGAISLTVAKERAARLATMNAERFGYKPLGDVKYRVVGDERGGTVVAVIEWVTEVKRAW